MKNPAQTALSAATLHRENVLQQHLVRCLVQEQGYVERAPDAFDRGLAVDRDMLLQFIRATQPDAWARLTEYYAASAEQELCKQLEKALRQRGTLDVLRQGLKMVPNIQLSFCYFQPASSLNAELVRLYRANILSVMQEVEYSQKHDGRIDVVLFVNGLPVATLELKNTLTGTTFRHAEKQYRQDRAPAGEPLLTFERGALVHFAVDQDNVSMTTRLQNGKTVFLPFNRGRDEGAGNPDVTDEFRIAYLYRDLPDCRAVFGRDMWLRILGQFLHRVADERKKALIFPRFHQFDAVTALMQHARTHGAGHNYLIQHSAGSGKSNTIAWTAHQVVNLHTDLDQPVFDSAIVVTDRVVLDRQLQGTIAQFEQTPGVVRKIDGTSRQLREAIEHGAKIIITTIQKFGTDHLRELSGQSGRRFAILVDEAHGSQSGKTAQSLTDALTREASSSEDVEDIIADYQKSRGPQANISTFAFTATPRNVTLERFGKPGTNGKPEAFHVYSMRQAIEEGFILDVLQNYMTYKAYYELEKCIESDPIFKTKKAQRKVARFAQLHPTAISQKVEVIVEHFRRHVLPELNGQAKAMVVTASREAALRYHFGLRDYIAAQGYQDLRTLVAFSGELDLDGQTYTEAELNGFGEKELPERFDGFRKDGTPYPERFHLLIVAEKYQTGFDQPKLCAMYVDRKLDGLQAVQTLSRLNRTMSGKERTCILDFQNTVQGIQEAFAPFYRATRLEETSDPNQIYELESRLKTFGILDAGEIERFAAIFYGGVVDATDRAKLEALIRSAVERFAAEQDEGRKEEFRQLLKSYCRFYSFVAQVVQLGDTGLEKLYGYAVWLLKKLPDREVPPEVDVTEDMLRLRAFRIEQKESGSASLAADTFLALNPIQEFAAKPFTEEEAKSFSQIIEAFNSRHGTEFSQEDFLRFKEVDARVRQRDDMLDVLRNNPADVAFPTYSNAFFEEGIRLFQRDAAMKNIFLTDKQSREQVIKLLFNFALRDVRQTQKVAG